MAMAVTGCLKAFKGHLIEVTGGIEGGRVKGRFHYALMAGLMAGRGRNARAMARDGAVLRSKGGLEVEGKPDVRARSGSE
jgi:hypothetical protein